MIKRESCVVYIDTNKILFYTKDAKNVLQLDLPLEVVSDLEIVNREKFEQLVDNFFQTPSFKGKEFDCVLVFSQNTTFEKELIDNNSKIESEETQKFLDMVPFEDILSNSYKINRKTKIVAVNKILYDIVRQSFEKNKVHICLVLPMTVLSATNTDLVNKIDLSYIEGKLESFRQYSIIDLNEMGLGGEVTNVIGIKKKDVRLYVLLGVFVLLLLILFVLVYTTFFSTPNITKKRVVFPRVSITPVEDKNENPVATESGNISTPSSILQQNSSQ